MGLDRVISGNGSRSCSKEPTLTKRALILWTNLRYTSRMLNTEGLAGPVARELLDDLLEQRGPWFAALVDAHSVVRRSSHIRAFVKNCADVLAFDLTTTEDEQLTLESHLASAFLAGVLLGQHVSSGESR